MSSSCEKLLLESVENQGYAKGHRGGCATGRTQGRTQGIRIAKRQMAKALLREGLALAAIAKVTDIPITDLAFLLPDTGSVNQSGS